MYGGSPFVHHFPSSIIYCSLTQILPLFFLVFSLQAPATRSARSVLFWLQIEPYTALLDSEDSTTRLGLHCHKKPYFWMDFCGYKYIFRYVTKGSDCANTSVEKMKRSENAPHDRKFDVASSSRQQTLVLALSTSNLAPTTSDKNTQELKPEKKK